MKEPLDEKTEPHFFSPSATSPLKDFRGDASSPVLLFRPRMFASFDFRTDGRGDMSDPVLDSEDVWVAVIPPRTGALWLGRDVTCHVVLPFSTVSRHHALIHRKPDGTVLLEDKGSKNGTVLNGHPLNPGIRMPLEDNAQLMVGDLELTYAVPKTFAPILRNIRR